MAVSAPSPDPEAGKNAVEQIGMSKERMLALREQGRQDRKEAAELSARTKENLAKAILESSQHPDVKGKVPLYKADQTGLTPSQRADLAKATTQSSYGFMGALMRESYGQARCRRLTTIYCRPTIHPNSRRATTSIGNN